MNDTSVNRKKKKLSQKMLNVIESLRTNVKLNLRTLLKFQFQDQNC